MQVSNSLQWKGRRKFMKPCLENSEGKILVKTADIQKSMGGDGPDESEMGFMPCTEPYRQVRQTTAHADIQTTPINLTSVFLHLEVPGENWCRSCSCWMTELATACCSPDKH